VTLVFCVAPDFVATERLRSIAIAGDVFSTSDHSHRLPTDGTRLPIRAVPLALRHKNSRHHLCLAHLARSQEQRMNGSITAAVASAIVLSGGVAASADPIIIVRDQRATTVVARTDLNNSGPDTFRTAETSDTLQSTLSASSEVTSGVSTATLVSSFGDPMHWFGMGSADVSASAAGFAPSQYDAGSAFRVAFDVTAPLAFEFTGTFDQSNTFSGSSVSSKVAYVLAGLRPFDVTLPPVFTVEGEPHANRSLTPVFAGILAPGRYQLFITGASNLITSGPATEAGHADYTFRFDLTPGETPAATPEPASLLLLSTAIAGVFGFRSRKGNRGA
jgi:PEP-CTERM motif-containing protein